MNIQPLASPTTVQMDSDKLADLKCAVESMVADGTSPGVQLVVARHGQVVLDMALGQTLNDAQNDVNHRTLFYSWSVVKPITAMAVHLLIERGQIGMDTPVAEVWPEFGQHDKQRVTVGQVLAHRAGFPLVPPTLKWYDYANWEVATQAIA